MIILVKLLSFNRTDMYNKTLQIYVEIYLQVYKFANSFVKKIPAIIYLYDKEIKFYHHLFKFCHF